MAEPVIPLLEDAVHLLRRAPLSTWVLHFTGSVPFAPGFGKNKDLARTLRVDNVTDKGKQHKFEVRDERKGGQDARAADAASKQQEAARQQQIHADNDAAAGDNSEARLRAEACLAAAKEEGIAREDIEEETGDLVAYMGAVIATLVNHPEREAPSTEDMREDLIRTKAFFIWIKVVLRGARTHIGKWRLNWLQPKSSLGHSA